MEKGFSVIVVIIAIGYMRDFYKKNVGNDEDRSYVHFPKIWLKSCMFFFIFFLTFPIVLFVLIQPNFKDFTMLFPIFSFFAIMAVSLMITYKKWRIDYDANGFQWITTFGRKHKYKYSDITWLEDDRPDSSTIIHTTSKKLYISTLNIGGEEFLHYVKKIRRKLKEEAEKN